MPSLHRLAQLHQYTTARLGVKEGHEFVVGSALRLAVEWDETLGFEPLDFSANVGYLEGDVVDAFAALFDELGDGAFGIAGFQQFNFAFADAEKRGGNMLALHVFHLVMGFAEEFSEQFVAVRHAFDGDADVVDFQHKKGGGAHQGRAYDR